MSDGDNATPGHHGVPDTDGDNPWRTRTPRPSMGAAPWERGGIFGGDRTAGRPWSREGGEAAGETSADGGDAADEPSGSRADSTLTVADLIAKVGDEPRARRAKSRSKPDRPRSHRIEPEHRPVDAPPDDVAPSDAITTTIPRACAPDLPDLEATRTLPTADRVPPTRIGGGAFTKPEPEPKRHRLMILGRAAAA